MPPENWTLTFCTTYWPSTLAAYSLLILICASGILTILIEINAKPHAVMTISISVSLLKVPAAVRKLGALARNRSTSTSNLCRATVAMVVFWSKHRGFGLNKTRLFRGLGLLLRTMTEQSLVNVHATLRSQVRPYPVWLQTLKDLLNSIHQKSKCFG